MLKRHFFRTYYLRSDLSGWIVLIKSEVLIMTAVVDPDLQIRGGAGHPDPDIKGGGGVVKKNFFGSSGGLGPSGPSPGFATGLECSGRSALTNGNHPKTDT